MRRFQLFDEFAGPVTGEQVVRPQAEVIKFAPGLVPVLKHGRHDQSSHGRRGGSTRSPSEEAGIRARQDVDYIMGRTMVPPSWTGPAPTIYVPKRTLNDRVQSVKRKIRKWKADRERRELMNMSQEDLDKIIAANRARVNAQRAERGLPPRVYKANDPVLRILQQVFGDIVDPSLWVALMEDPRPLTDIDGPLGELLDEMFAAIVPDETVIKFAPGLRPVLKHLQGKHDQKSHGRGGQQTLINAPFDEWGDRAPRIRRMENVGPTAEQIKAAMFYEPNESVISDYIFEAYGDEIDSQVEDYRNTTADVTDEAVADYRSQLENEFYNKYRFDAEIYERESFEEALREDFAEVYDVTHTGIDRSGARLTIESRTKSATIDEYESTVTVEGILVGTLENGKTIDLGHFKRTFSPSQITDDGIEVEHDWFRIDPEGARGTGFGREFIQRQEDYYISKGVDRITVHAALEDGGYTWARAGFDWNPLSSQPYLGTVPARLDSFINVETNSSVRNGLLKLKKRLEGDKSSPDYPTPNEIATWGYREGLSMWPGREIMGGTGRNYGSNWFGQKILTPDGIRQTGRETLPTGTSTRKK